MECWALHTGNFTSVTSNTAKNTTGKRAIVHKKAEEQFSSRFKYIPIRLLGFTENLTDNRQRERLNSRRKWTFYSLLIDGVTSVSHRQCNLNTRECTC